MIQISSICKSPCGLFRFFASCKISATQDKISSETEMGRKLSFMSEDKKKWIFTKQGYLVTYLINLFVAFFLINSEQYLSIA